MRSPDRSRDLVAAGANLAHDALAAEVLAAFAGVGAESIVLKGPSLSRWLDSDVSPRFSVDVDLLVPPWHIAAAERALVELGFEPLVPPVTDLDRPAHARAWHRAGNAIDVDLHRTLVGVGASDDVVWHTLRERSEETLLAGHRARILEPAGQAMHVALHAAHHGTAHGKSLADLARALEIAGDELWHSAAALADELQALPAFMSGLLLRPSGQALAERLGLAEEPSVEGVLRARSAPPQALGLEWLVRLPGTRAKARFVLRKLVPPPAWVRAVYPVARRGRAGLVAGYGSRWLALLVSIVPALLSWFRARATARKR